MSEDYSGYEASARSDMITADLQEITDVVDFYRAALERLAQAMPLADPNAHLAEELHARINYAREALKR